MSTALRGTRIRRPRAPAPGGAQAPMTKLTADRFMWRTGFGPTEADRKRLIGRSLHKAVDQLLSTPAGPLRGAAPVVVENGAPRALKPLEQDSELVLEWCDRMIRGSNPFVERMAFFWHNHFATIRSEVSPPQLMRQQIDLFRRYGDLAGNPAASFKTLLYEVGEGPAMLRFLNGEQSTRQNPNENYGREICELFGLGILDARGVPNYTEEDVKEIARATTGWRIDETDPNNPKGIFVESRFDDEPKKILGRTGNFGHRQTVDIVLSHHAHGPFLVNKLWSEFVPGPPPKATLSDLVKTYKRSGLRIRPVIRKILTDPMFVQSLTEPNMLKPPVVFAMGLMRTLGLTIENTTLFNRLDGMGQVPYFPPTVAGWEGGISWLNTNTALTRFQLANQLCHHEKVKPTDAGASESYVDAFKRAYAAVGKPWIAPKSKSALLFYAKRAPATSEDDRIARQSVLRAMLLGGPDAQVM
jgi:uncharacterized protein (DUF1800 family)